MTRLIGLLACAVLLATAVHAQDPPGGSPLASLVGAERAFSRMSVAEGARAAFLAYFAGDGVSFSPGPVNTRETFGKLPAAPPTVVLEWVPVTADIARSGDLGYTTGPWVRSERKPGGAPIAWGWYFTVWKKQDDGSWKAVADIGTETPAHGLPGTDAFHAAPSGEPPSTTDSSPRQADPAAVEAAERTLSALAAVNALGGYLAVAADGLRLHRDGVEPIVGVAAVKTFLAGKPARIESIPLKTDVSRSGDFGYAYGSYVAQSQGSSIPKEERGFYLRVWKVLGGGWRLVADITNAASPAAPPR